MCCFVAPLTEAIATSVVKKRAEANGNDALARDLKVLERMLWGGSVVLMLEHIWNGEVSWRFPFISGFEEIMTVGLAMCAVVTGVWWFTRERWMERVGTLTQMALGVGMMFGVDWIVG